MFSYDPITARSSFFDVPTSIKIKGKICITVENSLYFFPNGSLMPMTKLSNLESENIIETKLATHNQTRSSPGLTSIDNLYLVVTGGSTVNKSEYYSSVEKYDITNNTWMFGPDMHIPRRLNSSCCLS